MARTNTSGIILGIIICLMLIIISAIIIYPVMTAGTLALRTKFDPSISGLLLLELAVFVAFITSSDNPERIRQSE
jgi:hypothetical protein